jgi:hypothetical protein
MSDLKLHDPLQARDNATEPCSMCGTLHDPIYCLCPTRCPNCGYTGTLDSFDAIGASGSELFCNSCREWIDPI